ncbi:MAG: radical SAM protein [Pseudomonadota bacterium]
MPSKTDRILLISPAVAVGPEWIDSPEWAGLGMVHLGGALRAGGAAVHLLEARAQPGAGATPRRGGGWLVGAPPGAWRAPLEGADFDLALVHWTPFHAAHAVDHGLWELLATLRRLRPDARIGLVEAHVGGMHHVEIDGEALLAAYPHADFFIRHEAESTMVSTDWRSLQGVVTGEPVTNLDALPLPAWDLVDPGALDGFLTGYLAATGKANPFRIGQGSRPALFSRGCPYACAFCTSGPPAAGPGGRRYRPLSLTRANELLDALRAHGARHVVILDDAANVRRDFSELLEGILARDLTFDIPNGLRADLLDREAITLLVRGGGPISISAESAAPRVQAEIIGKGVDRDAVERVAAWTKEAGGRLLIHWMVALPGERRDETRATIAAAQDLLDRTGAVPLIQYATPLPGAPLGGGPVPPGGFEDPATAMRDGPRWVPEGATREEVVSAVALLRERSHHTAPQKVIVNITYRCNNHCRFCAVGNRIQEDLPLDEIKPRLLEHRAAGIELLDLDGGEPTLVPRLPELVRWARAQGFRRVNVTTNGRTLANPGTAGRLAAAGLTDLLISLHGPTAEIHDEITMTPGSFDQTTRGILHAVEECGDGVDLGVNTTIARGNANHLEETAALIHRLGVRRLNLQFLTPFGRAHRDIVPDPATAAATVRGLLDRWRDRLAIQVINLPFCSLPGYEDFLASDVGKLSRRMLFVTQEEVNLFEYLAGTRTRDAECEGCLLLGGCDGKYLFDGPSHD